ncbi:MAG TPA: hypothetical protein VMV79_01945 [Alphaproteobacteria bacterium]|nr:hypothetical protein [Alphaproteobacteria bacterium]
MRDRLLPLGVGDKLVTHPLACAYSRKAGVINHAPLDEYIGLPVSLRDVAAFSDVVPFHVAFGHDVSPKPRLPPHREPACLLQGTSIVMKTEDASNSSRPSNGDPKAVLSVWPRQAFERPARQLRRSEKTSLARYDEEPINFPRFWVIRAFAEERGTKTKGAALPGGALNLFILR